MVKADGAGEKFPPGGRIAWLFGSGSVPYHLWMQRISSDTSCTVVKPNRLAELLMLVVTGALLAASAAAAAPSTASLEDFGATTDGAGLVESMWVIVHKWSDYTCESELWVYKPDKIARSGCKFFYKDPSQVRVQVMGGGFRDGSVVVRQKDGSVRAHGGGLLGHMIMNLDPDSRLLILPNGANVTKCDLPSVIAELRASPSAGKSYRATLGPVQTDDMPERMYVLDEYEKSAPQPLRRLFVEPSRKLPIRIDTYHGQKRFSSAWFRNISVNNGLSEELFRL